MPHGIAAYNQAVSTPPTTLLGVSTPSGVPDAAVIAYGTLRCKTAATLGIAVLTMNWHDGTAPQSKALVSISLASLTSSPFTFGFSFDYGAGVTYQVDLIGVLGSPVFDLAFIFEPLIV